MIQEYVISFSSFYKAAYAEDMLEEAGIVRQTDHAERYIFDPARR